MSALKGGLLLVPSAVAATMAAWQIQRMQWKVSAVAGNHMSICCCS
jgi:cytochrome oxidase assembly protein ShyY1